MTNYPPQNPGQPEWGSQGNQGNNQGNQGYQGGQGNQGAAPGYGQPTYGSSQPDYGATQQQPSYGSQQPTYGQPSYGSQPDFGSQQQPTYGQPAYGQPAYGQPGGPGGPGSPGFGGPGYGAPPPNNTNRNIIIAIIVVLVLAGGGIGIYFATKSDNSKKKADNPSSSGPVSPGKTGFPNSGGNQGGSQGSSGGGDASTALTAWAQAFASHNLSGVTQAICSDATGAAASFKSLTASDLQSVGTASVTTPPDSSGSGGEITIQDSSGSKSVVIDVGLANESGWCVQTAEAAGGGSMPGEGSGSPSGGTSDSGASLVGTEVFLALETHDLSELKSLACTGRQVTLSQASLDKITSATTDGDVQVSGDTATQNGTITTSSSSSISAVATLHSDSSAEGWCLYDLTGM